MSLTLTISNPTLSFDFNVSQVAGSCSGYPDEADVLATVVYGNASEFTGSLVAASFGTVTLSANDTTPLTGDVVTFTPSFTGITPDLWTVDFGDGNVRSETGATITHKYRNPGTYTIELTGASGTTAVKLLTKTNYITASEDDLTAYGTLHSWVNFQDESNVTETAGRLTNYNDNVTGLDWIIDAGSGTNPLYKNEYDQYGLYKCLSLNPEYLDMNSGTYPPSLEQNVILDDSGDEVAIDCGTESAHFFFVARLENTISNYRILTSLTSASLYFRLNTSQNFHFRTLSTNAQQSLSAASAHWSLGRFYTFEITISSGTINYIVDGNTLHTQTSVTGNFLFGRFGGSAASQNPPITHISSSVFNSVLTGSNLTAVRAYHNNKKPSDL